jgi:hypothetical protein
MHRDDELIVTRPVQQITDQTDQPSVDETIQRRQLDSDRQRHDDLVAVDDGGIGR